VKSASIALSFSNRDPSFSAPNGCVHWAAAAAECDHHTVAAAPVQLLLGVFPNNSALGYAGAHFQMLFCIFRFQLISL
jgi:hypothetical protein